MSKYTTEVRYICENAAGYKESKGYADIDKIIEDSIDSIFSFNFPIFDASYRNVLCTKILRHYYTREIGFETVGLWKLKLQTKLTEIMPYYNQLYASELIKFNPLYDVDLSTTHVGNKSGDSNNTTANNKNAENNRDESHNGISQISNEKTENNSVDKNSNYLENENKDVNSSSEGSNLNVNSAKNKKDYSNLDKKEIDKSEAENKGYNDTQGGTNWDLYSDTPQGGLVDVDEEEYLTNARKITDAKNKQSNENTVNVLHENNELVHNGRETADNEETNLTNDNVKNEYDEKNSRTNIGNEKEVRSGSATDSANKNEFGNSTIAENSKSTENTVSADTYNSTESYALHVVGKQAGASYSKLLKEFRDTFLNIDMDVINSLSDLFMNLW